MFFNKKIDKAAQLLTSNPNRTYWQEVSYRFGKNRIAIWALRFLYVILFIALAADFIANDKPLVCSLDKQIHFPIFHGYGVKMGIAKWEDRFVTRNWNEHNYDWAVFPPIPYSPTSMDKRNRNYVGPFDEQHNTKSIQYRHWMGTDELGRDVASGMIHGTRIAVSVGIIAMSIASLIGIFFGALAGYWGDHKLRLSIGAIVANLIGLVMAVFYAFVARSYQISVMAKEGSLMGALLGSFAIFVLVILIANALGWMLGKLPLFSKRVTIPADILVMRLIEVINSIPALLLILSIVAITKPSVFNVMVIIGFISWTGIARFVRAELLRVRNLEYIEAAQAMGFSESRIVLRHALPNALTPVLIAIAFGVASAILTESFLSFLSVGVSAEQVTWGSLLNLARGNFQAWWLALFPGVAIFITVTIFNLIGEGLTDALDPRLKH